MALSNTLHKLASPFLYRSGIYEKLWRRNGRPLDIVLVYHRVVDKAEASAGRFGIEKGITADVFEAQLRFMLKHFEPILASEVMNPERKKLRFAVTLDDGYEDNYFVAAPILDRLGIPATFYAVSDFVGTQRLFWWEQLADIVSETRVPSLDVTATLPDLTSCAELPAFFSMESEANRNRVYEQLSAAIRRDSHAAIPERLQALSLALKVGMREEGRKYPLMDWSQLRSLAARGHEIGGHTASHSNVFKLSDELMEYEIVTSSAMLENRLNLPMKTFAYPYGHFDDDSGRVRDALMRSGCKLAFTALNGVVSADSAEYALPRTCLNRRYDFACAYNVQNAIT